MNKKILSILCLLTLCGCNPVTSSEVSSSTSSSLTIKDIEGGKGEAYEPYIIREGAYNATLTNSNELVYYGFMPTRPGKYVIESFCNIDGVNPNVGYYGNNSQYVPESPVNDLYNDDSNGVNFKLEFNIAIEEFVNTGEYDKEGNLIYQYDDKGNLVPGGAYLFGIAATGVNEKIQFPIQVTWLEHYESEKVQIEDVAVTSTLSQYPEKALDAITVTAPIDGTLKVVYNEEDGFYHVDTKDGYILNAKISVPCSPYLDRAFSKYNEETQANEGIVGERNIILKNGTKDYSNLLKEYEKYCNSDGVYGVTEELKTFLTDYFEENSQWIEYCLSSSQVLSNEDGWLFACEYYGDISDSYKKPWSGTGTSEDPYILVSDGLTYEYYAKVPENGSLYYSYAIKNTQKEVHVYVKTTEENAKFIYDEKEYTFNNGLVYLEVDLGGGMATRNPNDFIFEMTSTNGSAANFVFEVGIREDTVAGDALRIGENTVEVEKNSYVECVFTAPEAGSYTFTSSEEKAWIEYKGQDYKGSDGDRKSVV